MAIVLRSPAEIELLRAAGRLVAECLGLVRSRIAAGVTTEAIDRAVEELILSRGATPVFKGYRLKGKPPFPCATCISIDEEVVHGIPGSRRLAAGEIVSVDVGVRRGGYIGDAAWSFPVGEPAGEVQRLLEVGELCLERAIAAVRPARPLSEVSRAIQSCAEASGFAVVRAFVGHGVGKSMHEEPEVPNCVTPAAARGTMRPGMVFAIEPMVNAGTGRVATLGDMWTVVTADQRPSVHFEHTVAVTETGVEVLSRP